MVDYAIAEFNKIHPDVKVVLERQQWTGIVEKLDDGAVGQRRPRRRRVRQHPGPGVRGRRRAGRPLRRAGRARRRRLPAEPARGRDVRRQAVRRAVLRRRPHHDLPQGPLRGGGHRGPDHARGDARRRRRAQGGQRRRRRTSPASTCRPATGTRRCRSSGTTAATSPPRKASEWVGQLDSPESIAGLEYFKQVFDEANAAPADGDDANDYTRLLQRRGRHDAGAGLEARPDHQPRRRLPRDGGRTSACSRCPASRPARPRRSSSVARTSASRPTARTRIWRSTCSRSWSRAGYQQQFAAAGTIPALKSELANVAGSDAAVAQADGRREQPLRADQREVGRRRGRQRAPDMLTEIAQGGDIAEAAAQADAAIEVHAQRLDRRHLNHQHRWPS